jgi:hypothetical protein
VARRPDEREGGWTRRTLRSFDVQATRKVGPVVQRRERRVGGNNNDDEDSSTDETNVPTPRPALLERRADCELRVGTATCIKQQETTASKGDESTLPMDKVGVLRVHDAAALGDENVDVDPVFEPSLLACCRCRYHHEECSAHPGGWHEDFSAHVKFDDDEDAFLLLRRNDADSNSNHNIKITNCPVSRTTRRR